jgi:type II secretory pathway pseudopilin PulG
MRRAGHPDADGEFGFTLIELVVFIAIVTILAGTAFATLAQRPAQARSTAIAFAGLVERARALAALTGAAEPGDGSGATIAIVQDGGDTVATLYRYRPIHGAAQLPLIAGDTPSLRTSTTLDLVQVDTRIAPPFALFFSPSGHVSVQAGYRMDSGVTLASEPACPLETGIVIAFIDGVHDQAYPLSCEIAGLDLTLPHAVNASRL